MEGHNEHFVFVEQDVKDKEIPLLPPLSNQPQAARRLSLPWGLNRIDQRELPMDRSYKSGSNYRGGRGTHVYVMDTGVRTTHGDFQGRAIPTLEVLGRGPRVCNGDVNCAGDRDGHGTHCAGSVGGFKYGVAKKANIHAVKTLGDDGGGVLSWNEIAFDWVIAHGERPAVASLSLGGPGRVQSMEVAVNAAVRRGIVVVVAAGNQNDNACGYTPAYIPKVHHGGGDKE